MRKIALGIVAVAALGSGAWYYWSSRGASAAAETGTAPGAAGAPAGAAGGRAGGRGRGTLGTMTVDTAVASRHDVIDYITVVGNLIGEATVDIVPRVAGRLDSISVKLGDRVSRGQQLVKVEDRELREQVNQSGANIEVNKATIIARENDLTVAKNALERAKTSFQRELISRQALEDAEARYNSAASQIDVAKAQMASTQARLDELKITLGNTTVISPVDGFVAKRNLDQGSFAGANTVVLSLVDLSTVRMIANLVEKDFKRVQSGAQAVVEVDAFPGEQFSGQVSRVAPVFDPATRTATMEIEVPNPGFRLKPGMYARVRLTAERRADALTVPRNAVVDIAGKRGVFLLEGDIARFHEVQTGISDLERIEVVSGLEPNTRVITVGSLGLRDGDRVIVGGAARGGRGGRGAGGGRGDGQGAQGAPPATGGAQPETSATEQAPGGGRENAPAGDGGGVRGGDGQGQAPGESQGGRGGRGGRGGGRGGQRGGNPSSGSSALER